MLQVDISKTHETFDSTKHSNLDVANLKSFVTSPDFVWENERSSLFAEHRHTCSYSFTDFDLDWKAYDAYIYNEVSNRKDIFVFLYPIFEYLENLHDGKVGRSLVTKLSAHQPIYPHSDQGDYLNVVRRNHIPLVTNDNVYFSVDNNVKHFAEGEVWEINNSKQHFVVNNGNQDRIHLIIDIIPNRYIGE